MKYILILNLFFCLQSLKSQTNQVFISHMEAYVNGSLVNDLNPSDTGFVDICMGDTVVYVATPDFYNSLESTGIGYSQDVNVNIDFAWSIGDLTYSNNDTIIFVASLPNGYLVNLIVTDQIGGSLEITSKIRVGIPPDFSGVYVLEDSICEGSSTQIIGGANGEGSSFTIPGGSFGSSQYFDGLTYLPDGSGAQYEAPITIEGFSPGGTITSAQDLSQVCVTMEHSYSGDLEIWLQCPNGTTVALVNSYGGGGGALPGGNSGGGTYLGDPIDDFGGGSPGEGWEYCFSSVLNDIGPMTQNWGNTIPAPIFGNGNPSVSPENIYEPDNSFSDFTGCPFNGEWTLFIQDNLGIDDGYIFGWGIDFYESTSGVSGYQNTLDSAWWSPNATILNNIGDSSIIVAPENVGGSYTFNVMDDFGCSYDTTIAIAINAITASMDIAPVLGCVPIIVAFDYSASVGDYFYLDFGDGTYYNGSIPENISHFYSDAIDASAILYVNNGECSDTAYVSINTAAPTTNYISDSAVCGSIYDWNGDLIYDSGSYTQDFEGGNGCDSIVVLDFTFIDVGFELSFNASQQLFTAPPFAVQFTNTTPNMENYNFSWDFGDGTTIQSNNLNVFHEYISNGSFSVVLSAADLNGSCSDDLIETDYIFTTGMSSIHENTTQLYQLRPNPTSDIITIQSESSLNNKFSIYDQQGRQVVNGMLEGIYTEVSLGKLATGTYTIHIEGNFIPTVFIKQ